MSEVFRFHRSNLRLREFEYGNKRVAWMFCWCYCCCFFVTDNELRLFSTMNFVWEALLSCSIRIKTKVSITYYCNLFSNLTFTFQPFHFRQSIWECTRWHIFFSNCPQACQTKLTGITHVDSYRFFFEQFFQLLRAVPLIYAICYGTSLSSLIITLGCEQSPGARVGIIWVHQAH